ncbi:MAG TPA: LPS export ABC transporter periplasmic protein LptC, partial [Pyrinomonadaceae bacterium]|nr:LPS export ABC transporter periplasmic protein LptC [Pyrinomonadaceae bacterium]
MAENIVQKPTNSFDYRANLPKIIGGTAIFGLIVSLIWIGVSFTRREKKFVIKGKEVQLSKDVEGVITSYERRETEGDITKFYIKADKATTFTDKHQELENAYIEVYDEKGEQFDRITSHQAIYVPDPQNSKLFDAKFVGDVNIESRNGAKLKTELVTYNRESEVAESPESTEFERDNIKGKSTGAIFKIKEKRVELLKDVEITANVDPDLEKDEVAKAKLQSAKIVAGYAMVQETTKAEGQPIEQKIFAKQNVIINLVPLGNQGNFKQATDIKADEATAFCVEKQIKKIDLNGNTEIFAKPTGGNPEYTKINANQSTVEFEQELKNATAKGNVYIETNKNGKPTKIRAQNAVYDKPADKFDLKENVEIVTVEDNQPTTIHSSEAVYEQTNGKISLTGGAEITQGGSFVKGDVINAQLFPTKKLQNATAAGNAYLKQVTPEKTTEITGNELTANFNNTDKIQNAVAKGNAFLRQVSAAQTSEVRGAEMNAIFDANGIIQNAISTGQSTVVLVPTKPDEYSKATLWAPNSIKVFYLNGLMNQTQTDGRTTVKLDAPTNRPNSSNKKLTANAVKTFFSANGKDLSKVEAVGDAELLVEPLTAAPNNYRTTINGARFDCDFYEVGNIAKNCSATTKTQVVRVPTVANENRGVQKLWADKLNSTFNQQTQDIQQFDAIGNAKFNELDRNGLANQITYTEVDEVVKLRGGEPTVFDSRARAKAGEIDLDMKNNKSFLRSKVSTTYYSQKQTNGATPFTKTNTPVYITAENAQFDHQREIGIYTGNARAWQESNYVRSNELVLYQKESRFEGSGNVQSLLYNVKKKEAGKTTNQPVSAASERISYSDKDKHLKYENKVDIRQGTDRILSGVADIFLDANNEMKQTIVENDVVITQPNRKA